jgi:hypothetical protein
MGLQENLEWKYTPLGYRGGGGVQTGDISDRLDRGDPVHGGWQLRAWKTLPARRPIDWIEVSHETIVRLGSVIVGRWYSQVFRRGGPRRARPGAPAFSTYGTWATRRFQLLGGNPRLPRISRLGETCPTSFRCKAPRSSAGSQTTMGAPDASLLGTWETSDLNRPFPGNADIPATGCPAASRSTAIRSRLFLRLRPRNAKSWTTPTGVPTDRSSFVGWQSSGLATRPRTAGLRCMQLSFSTRFSSLCARKS